MSLAERLGKSPSTTTSTVAPAGSPAAASPTAGQAANPVSNGSVAARSTPVAVLDERPNGDGYRTLKEQVQAELYERLGPRLYEPDWVPDELEAVVLNEINEVLTQSPSPFTRSQQEAVISSIRDDVLGLGPIQRLVDDPTVSEVMVNGPNSIFVERSGKLEKTSVCFDSEQHLRNVIDRIVSPLGRRVDDASPMVDARLDNGSRVNAIIAPVAAHGSALTIRKFAEHSLTFEDLVRFGSLTSQAAELLKGCVRGRLNIVVSGGTGAGKTTMLNTMSEFISPHERVVSIEDGLELQLNHDNWIALEARPANAEGAGLIRIRDLVRNALRMRPDRILVGECRGGEALDMLQAMNTGHEGSMTTAHANTPRDLLSRLETMVLMSELDLPSAAIRDQVAASLQLIVQLRRLPDGRRTVTSITEVTGREEDRILLSDLFVFDWDAPAGTNGSLAGGLRATGIPPTFVPRLRENGVVLSDDIFTAT